MGMRAHCVAAAGEGWFIETQGLAPPGPAGHQATLGPPALARIFTEQVVVSATQETPTAPRADRGAARRHPPPQVKIDGRQVHRLNPSHPARGTPLWKSARAKGDDDDRELYSSTLCLVVLCNGR